MNGVELKGRALRVNVVTPKDQQGGGAAAAPESSHVFVGGCSTADVEVLKGVFIENNAPAIVNAKVVVDHGTGTSKGFAFVEFGSPEDAKAAVAAVNGKELEGKTLRVEVQSKGKGKGGDKGKGKGGDKGKGK